MRCTGPFLLLLLGIVAMPSAAAETPGPDRGTIEASLRWRYEDVDENAFVKDGRASTLRTTLSYRSPVWHGLSAFLEFENVHDFGLGDQHGNGGFGAASNGVTDRPTIADPEGTDVNQAYLRWAGPGKTTVDAGRYALSVADERFVGPVGWRQNHQTIDGVRVANAAIPRTKLLYAYLQVAHRIDRGARGMESHLLDVSIDAGPCGTVSPYFLFLDYDEAAVAGLSTSTFGLRWTGKVPLGEVWSLPVHAEAAKQKDAGDNPANVDADYVRLEVGAARDRLAFKAGFERLGGSAAEGRFTTPLATLHKFNGWADKFLTTPGPGLDDLYVSASGKAGNFGWTVAFHDFTSDEGSVDYGTEWDAELSWKARWGQTFAVKGAIYDADAFSTDTRKIWLYTAYTIGKKP